MTETVLQIPLKSIWMVSEVVTEYQLHKLPDFPADKPPMVLDIGGNVGIFAIAAASRWPGAKVHSYEPHPDTYRLLVSNLADVPGCTASCYAVVGDDVQSGAVILHEGARNRLCCSLIDRGDQDMSKEGEVMVHCLPAHQLPTCDVLKIDTEGCEVPILQRYAQDGKLATVKMLLAEIHKNEDFAIVQEMAKVAGLNLLNIVDKTMRFMR